MRAEYISSTSFFVANDRTGDFVKLRRVRLDCNDDGLQYSTVINSEFDGSNTTVIIAESVITPNLKGVKYSVVKPGKEGNEPPDLFAATEFPEDDKLVDFFLKVDEGRLYINIKE